MLTLLNFGKLIFQLDVIGISDYNDNSFSMSLHPKGKYGKGHGAVSRLLCSPCTSAWSVCLGRYMAESKNNVSGICVMNHNLQIVMYNISLKSVSGAAEEIAMLCLSVLLNGLKRDSAKRYSQYLFLLLTEGFTVGKLLSLKQTKIKT